MCLTPIAILAFSRAVLKVPAASVLEHICVQRGHQGKSLAIAEDSIIAQDSKDYVSKITDSCEFEICIYVTLTCRKPRSQERCRRPVTFPVAKPRRVAYLQIKLTAWLLAANSNQPGLD
jgi:hypothetical protein